MAILAVLINPKTQEPFQLRWNSDRAERDFGIYDGGEAIVAMGTFEDYGTKYNDCAEATGYPRVHTPEGVSQELRGGGLGTVLYTGMTTAAHMIATERIAVDDFEVEREGITSGVKTRSVQASAWWNRAVADYKLAKRSRLDIENDFGGDTTCSAECDIYPYAAALQNNLVIALEDADETWAARNDGLEPKDWRLVSRGALAAVDFLRLRERAQKKPTAILFAKFLLDLAAENDMPKKDIHDMRERLLQGVGLEALGPRDNPTRSRRTKRGTRYRALDAEPRSNPSTAEELADRQAERVRRLGWDKFAR